MYLRQITLRILMPLSIWFITSSPVFSFGDYPVASCKSWNGTIKTVMGQDSAHAVMVGFVTLDDIREYCGRVYGDQATPQRVETCAREEFAAIKEKRLRTHADCNRGTIIFDDPRGIESAQFPLPVDADVSCASGMPPLQAQFRILCPTNASHWGIQ